MPYQSPHHYSEVELLQAELADLKTDLQCAIRDGLPIEYIMKLEREIEVAETALELDQEYNYDEDNLLD
jgi:hypothetical protein